MSHPVVFRPPQARFLTIPQALLCTWHDAPFRRTHDLAEVAQQYISLDMSIEPTCQRAEHLTSYAWTFRYPANVEEPSRDGVQDALILAREVCDEVLSRLPAEVRP